MLDDAQSNLHDRIAIEHGIKIEQVRLIPENRELTACSGRRSHRGGRSHLIPRALSYSGLRKQGTVTLFQANQTLCLLPTL